MLALLFAITVGSAARAYEINEKVSVSGVASLAVQCQYLRGNDENGDLCRSALPFQPELSYRPAEAHELFFKLGFAAGNGLNDVTPFNLALWAADLEDSVENINGGTRDYLLTAWYRYKLELAAKSAFHFTAGIIDTTDYIDTNVYSNDEYTQFMNSALVNGPNAFAPSYAPGLVGQWLAKRVSLTGVYAHVSRADEDSFDFYGLEFGYAVDTPIGPGNYRLLVDTTSADFEDPVTASRQRQSAVLLSCDQQLARGLGVFVRIARRVEDAAIDYRSLYSAGVDIGGAAWGRPDDNIGVGYAYLADGTHGIVRSQVAEGYYRFVVLTALAITADVQYLRDDYRSSEGLAGWMVGLRTTVSF